MSERKICTKCKVEKFISEFHRHPQTRSGVGSWCKSCKNIQTRDRLRRLKSQHESNPIIYDPSTTLICSGCKLRLPLVKFSVNRYKITGVSSLCKKCNTRKYSPKSRLRKTGWSPEMIEEQLSTQLGVCIICNILLRVGVSSCSLAADHCHMTGTPRGILCKNCNSLIGFANDDPEILRRAARYVNGEDV